MLLLGVDPGFRNLGLALVDNGEADKPRVLKHTTLHNGSLKEWQKGFPKLLEGIQKFLGKQMPDRAAVEMISWYGKRRGSLQLAHLAGGCVGFLLGLGVAEVKFFSPKEVKAMSVEHSAPKGYDEHQTDALSLVRLLVSSK